MFYVHVNVNGLNRECNTAALLHAAEMFQCILLNLHFIWTSIGAFLSELFMSFKKKTDG